MSRAGESRVSCSPPSVTRRAVSALTAAAIASVLMGQFDPALGQVPELKYQQLPKKVRERLQEVTIIGCNSPHFHDGVAARRQRHYLLAKIDPARDGPAIHADNDIAEAQPGLVGWPTGRSAKEEHTVGIGEAERNSQWQLERLNVDAKPPLFRVVRLASCFCRKLEQAPLRLRRSIRAGRVRRRLLHGGNGSRLAADWRPRRHAHDVDAGIGRLMQRRAIGRHLRRWRRRKRLCHWRSAQGDTTSKQDCAGCVHHRRCRCLCMQARSSKSQSRLGQSWGGGR
jgi:hypothetical protein